MFRCNWEATNLQHSECCLTVYHSRRLSPKAIATDPGFKEVVRSYPNSPTKAIATAVNNLLCLRLPVRTLQRARNEVLGNKADLAAKDLANIGALLEAYAKLNPSDIIDLDVDSANELLHWFIAFDNSSLANGGILPTLFCDGAFIKNVVCPRFILVISALNTERQLVILAIACVKNESTETWVYMFSMFVRTALGGLVLCGRLVLMADRDGGLRAAASIVFPRAMLRFCILHVIKNAKQAGVRGDFRLLIKFAKAGSLWERDRLWQKLRESSSRLVEWLVNSSLFDYQIQAAPVVARGFPICGCVTNNPAEIANSRMNRPLDAAQSLREMTPGPMLREAMQIFSAQSNRYREHILRTSSLSLRYTKYAVQLFMQQQLESQQYNVTVRGIFSYVVTRRATSTPGRPVYKDSNNFWHCECCFLVQYRLLCRHILAVISFLESGHRPRLNVRRLLKQGGMGDMWGMSVYVNAFASLEVLVPSAAEELRCSGQVRFPRNVQLPAPVPRRGRPKKNRIKSVREGLRASAMRSAGLPAGTRATMCSICGRTDHNIRKCPYLYSVEED